MEKNEQTLEQARLLATAYHEAGHAVMAISLGRLVKKVTIEPAKLQRGTFRLGACELQKGRTKAAKDWIEDEVLILFAGMVAEARFTGKYCPLGARQDLVAINRLLQDRAHTEKQMERLHRRLLDKTEHILWDEKHAEAIEVITQELIEKTTISGRSVRHLFNQTMQKKSKK